jgi:hypothetical protein
MHVDDDTAVLLPVSTKLLSKIVSCCVAIIVPACQFAAAAAVVILVCCCSDQSIYTTAYYTTVCLSACTAMLHFHLKIRPYTQLSTCISTPQYLIEHMYQSLE